ncbi:MAG: hypothetical protein RQM92_08460 [Candidatus Syntrophopropionicum ammoniitolerans]
MNMHIVMATLSIGEGQTISQPYIVAYMIEALNPSKNDIVLEIGYRFRVCSSCSIKVGSHGLYY